MPHWLVDGMNVIGSRPDGWWRDRTGAMARLTERLEAFAAAGDDPVTVVFDGRPRPVGEPEGVEVVFAPGGRDAADDQIVRMAEGWDDRTALRVATSDRVLTDRLAALGVAVEGAGGFLARLDRDGT